MTLPAELADRTTTLLARLHHRMHPTEPTTRSVALPALAAELGLYAIEQSFWQYITYTALVWRRAGALWVTLPAPMDPRAGATAELSSIDLCRWRDDDDAYLERLRAEMGALGAETSSARVERDRVALELHGALAACLAADAPHRHADALALLELLLTHSGAGSSDVRIARVVPEPRGAIAGGWQVCGTSFEHQRIDGYAGGFRDVTARLTLSVDDRAWTLRRQVVREVGEPGLAMT